MVLLKKEKLRIVLVSAIKSEIKCPPTTLNQTSLQNKSGFAFCICFLYHFLCLILQPTKTNQSQYHNYLICKCYIIIGLVHSFITNYICNPLTFVWILFSFYWWLPEWRILTWRDNYIEQLVNILLRNKWKISTFNVNL